MALWQSMTNSICIITMYLQFFRFVFAEKVINLSYACDVKAVL